MGSEEVKKLKLRKTLRKINKQLAFLKRRRTSMKNAFKSLRKHSSRRRRSSRRLTMAPGDPMYRRTVRSQGMIIRRRK